MTDKTIDIIVPVYNEEEGLKTFYDRIQAIPLKYNLIFIDNASTDNTLNILKSFDNVKIIEHEKNEGYGGSIIDGIKHSNGDIIVIIDADLEYPPEAIPELIKKLETSNVVHTSRFLGIKDSNMPFLKEFGNKVISFCFNMLFRQSVTDLYTGSKAFKRSVLDGIDLNLKGFEHVLELAVKLSIKGVKIEEMFVDFEGRKTGSSNMKHIPETIKYFILLFYYFLFKRKYK